MSKSLSIIGFIFAGALFTSVIVGDSIKSELNEGRRLSPEEESLEQGVNIRFSSVRAEAPKTSELANVSETLNISGTVTLPPLSSPPDELPVLKAEAAAVRELQTSYSLYDFNTSKRWPIASITKLMTAVVAIESFDKNTQIPISESALLVEGIAGNFEVGQIYTIEDLLKIMIIVSSNDSAETIREVYDGQYGPDSFVLAMNSRAESLGMLNTTFADPTGLSILNQSTVDDLTKLTQFIYNNYPEFFEWSKRIEISVTEINSGQRRTLLNINKLAGDERFLGGKTGFIEEAGGNLVSIFSYESRPITIIVLGSRDQESRFEDTALLREWLVPGP
jgi:serine-type D-Ala-D-Ala endopeptidase (penicillin-binding protein 7)